METLHAATKMHSRGNKRAEEWVDVESISLSRIHQEHTFRHSSACRTPGESGQEDLTSGKEYIEPHKTQ